MVVEDYNPLWAGDFISLKKIYEKELSSIKAVEHVGSTSIEGMRAKPIIDIDIVVESEAELERTIGELAKIGYAHVGDQGIKGREAFKRNGDAKIPVLDDIGHHLYVCLDSNEEYRRHVKFRDTLRNTPNLVKEYNDIKAAILRKVGNDNRAGYVDTKDKEYKWFFEKVLNPECGNRRENGGM